MHIVIVGAGKIGYNLAVQLSKENHNIVIIDKNLELLKNTQNKLDVAVVAGNGASAEVQREASVDEADLLIAVTGSDEVNLLCSMVAHKLGCHSIIARIRNPEYDRQMKILDPDFGITFSFNAEKTAANEIFHLLQFPSFVKRDTFAGGRADMVELKLLTSSNLVGKKLSQIGEFLKCKAMICAVERNGKIEIPSGSFELSADDKLVVAAAPKELPKIVRAFGMSTVKIKKVVIVGGSNIAVYLAQLLTENKIGVKLIELSPERCRFLTEKLPDVSVICGNGADQQLLIDENISAADAVVSLTGVDEENFMISMFANYLGVPKTITKNNHIEYSDIFKGTGVDTIISPKLLAANLIVRYVRAAEASANAGGVDALYRILDGKAEALGFTVPETWKNSDVTLEQLKFRENTLIALILRDSKVIIPHGTDCLKPGDSIIAVTKPEYVISKVQDLFLRKEGAER